VRDLADDGTTVILVRHAESTWNEMRRWQGQADPPLSNAGRDQARRVAERLCGEPITALYASDLRRAFETAEIIGAMLGLEARAEPRLRELDLGAWAGLTSEEIAVSFAEQFQAWQEHKVVRPGGGELFDEMQQRAVEAVQEIVAAHPGETVCAVTHGGVVYALRGHTLGIQRGPALFEGLPHNRNTAITILHFQDGRAELRLLMDAGHLQDVGDKS